MTASISLFVLFVLATFFGVLGSELTARYLGERQARKRNAQAMEAFSRLLSEGCDDPTCEVHGTGTTTKN